MTNCVTQCLIMLIKPVFTFLYCSSNKSIPVGLRVTLDTFSMLFIKWTICRQLRRRNMTRNR